MNANKGTDQKQVTDLEMVDRPGVFPLEEMRKLFESSVRGTAAFSARLDLRPSESGGRFTGYGEAFTHALWLGFATGLRCFERMEKMGAVMVRSDGGIGLKPTVAFPEPTKVGAPTVPGNC